MNVDTNAAASSLSDLSMDIDTLEKHAEAFPFSAYVRYLLLLQYKKHGHNNFEKELQKTALYFTNAQWLEFQLANTNNGEGESPHDSYSDTHHFAVLTEEQIENTDHSEANTDIDDESVLLQTKTQQEEILPATENVIESSTENNLEVVTTNEEIIAAEELHPEVYQPGDHSTDINASAYKNDDDYSAPQETSEIIEAPDFNEDEDEERETLNEIIENTEGNKQQKTEITEEVSQPGEDKVVEAIIDTAVPGIPTTETLNESANEEAIAFEPLHTVDYFASQGIKITDEVFTNDKLGTQMKSFTEWLRSMKKHPGANLPQQNSLAENIIQSAAESSNIDTEVLTEAMAEVLIKQDKREKAIEMYTKLSLINPAKSAYFADKIQNIKST